MAIPRRFEGLALKTVPYSSALKQGTGINPVHSYRDQTGRNLAGNPPDILVDPALVSADDPSDNYGYTMEDGVYQWVPSEGGHETGTYDHPSWQENSNDSRRDVMPGYPSWGPGINGIPKGTAIRAIEKGAIARATPNQLPTETVSEGWRNKEVNGVNEPGSGISDPAQYEMQTSMQQLRRTRAGSQRGTGSASEYVQPIETRVPGQKVLFYSGKQRHYDMAPKVQDVILRPFKVRTAGTDDPNKMGPNAMYRSEPLQRSAPGDPYQGRSVPDDGTDFANQYGYTQEDMVW